MASLDMSLDDMIKIRRSNRGRGQGMARRGRGRGRGQGGSFSGGRITGAPHRGPLRVNARPSSYAIAKSFRRTKSFPWQHDLFEDSLRAAGISGVENGTKLYISNLNVGVTNEDIKELFAEIGELKRYVVHYDKIGRSTGSAEVVFARRSDAFQALKRYNNVQLDGRPLKIEIIGTNSEVSVSARVNVGGANGRRTVVLTPRGRGRGFAAVNRGSSQRSRGALRNVRGHTGGRGRGRGRKSAVERSADELDKELDNYHAEAMQT